MNYYKEKIKELNADGIDFVPICFSRNHIEKVIVSYTKEQFVNINYFPKTNYRYWKVKDGKKVYLNSNKE